MTSISPTIPTTMHAVTKSKPTIPFTAGAFAKLKAEKDRLTKLRVEVMARLKEAREQGDLSENGAYTYAKFELGAIGRQLRTLNHQITNGFVAEKPTNSATAQFGSTITLTNLANQQRMTFQLVSQFESDPTQHKLSVDSPIGQAVLGKKVGETIHATLPRGTAQFNITKIV